MGLAFDSACAFWSNSCGSKGSCSLYDGEKLRTLLLIIVFTAKGFSTFCLFLAWLLYKPSTNTVVIEVKDDGASSQGHENPALDKTEF